jgi:hypothetical protein
VKSDHFLLWCTDHNDWLHVTRAYLSSIQKLIVAQLIKKRPVFYETRRFSTVFRRPCLCTQYRTKWIIRCYSFKIHINSILLSTPRFRNSFLPFIFSDQNFVFVSMSTARNSYLLDLITVLHRNNCDEENLSIFRSRKPRLTAVGIRWADHATPSIHKSWH